jgi:hypothetical protein
MVSKRPFKFTTQEIATVFWCIGLLIFIVIFETSHEIITIEDKTFSAFIIGDQMILFIGVGIFFTALAYTLPCYAISKWNLNVYIDKMEQGWTAWLRFTKSRIFAPQVVRTGPLGQQKGLVEGYKADIINRGDFPVTLQNGNHAVIKYDLMSHNVNLNEAVGWTLTVHKWGWLGSAAYKRCLNDGQTLKSDKEKEKKA